jgi:UPF0755 protein
MVRFIIVVAVLAGLVWGAFQLERMHFEQPGPAANAGAETVVLVQPGEGLAAISQELAQAGTIDNAILFQFGVRLRGKSAALKAGEYAIASHASMAAIMGILASGKSIEHKITAAEGLTSEMIYDLVKNDPELTGDMGEQPAEGTLLPETYLFIRGTTRADIIERMREAQKKFLDVQWESRTPDLPIKTKSQAMILASIVEKETALPEERRHIAAVFVNRLRLGMKLQSDPTIIYGLTKGYPLGRGIRESELLGATPYNRRRRSATPERMRSRRCSIPNNRTISISSRAAREGMCFLLPLPSMRRTSPICAASNINKDKYDPFAAGCMALRSGSIFGVAR